MLVGMDEAGRGPVLGPLVIGICAVPLDAEPLLISMGVKDSKDLSPRNANASKHGSGSNATRKDGLVRPWPSSPSALTKPCSNKA